MNLCSRVGKSEWVLGRPSKFQTRLDFFFLELREYLFLRIYFSAHPTSLNPLGNPLGQSSPRCEWAETMLCLWGRGLSSHWPQRVQSCLRALVMVGAECGAWPVAELCGDLCALRFWSTWKIAEVTDAKHLVNSGEAKFAVLQSV